MRITLQAKEATQTRILKAARKLFREKGFAEATIRDISREAGIATGTMFNYFRSKEEIVVTLAMELITKAHKEFQRKRHESATLREDLFLHVASQFRCLTPLKKFIQPFLDTAVSPATLSSGDDASHRLRADQLELLGDILRIHDVDPEKTPLVIPIYWALYSGVLSFWAQDRSPKNEDSLAMLDQSMLMFESWLTPDN